MSAPVLSARGLSKAYGSRSLFERLDLTVSIGEKVGLLGENGAGKSTLMRVLAQREPSDGGTLELKRGARVMLLDQRPDLPPDRTPRQIVLEGLGAWHEVKQAYEAAVERSAAASGDEALVAAQSELAETLEHLGGWNMEHLALDVCARLGVIDLDRPVGTMSGGEQRRVALARLLVSRPDLAILDEPTNHLDTETIAWLEEHLTSPSFPGAALVVTHDRYFLDAVCDRMLELELGKLAEYSGGYTDYVEKKAELLAHEARVEQNRQNLLRRETAWLRRGAKARSTKQKARIQRAQDLISSTPAQREERGALKDAGQRPTRLGKTILDLEGVGIDLGGRTLLGSLDLRLVSGERVGIIGKNGAGKTSLLRCILGELPAARGRVVLGQNTTIAVVDQARADLVESWSVLDNVAGFEGAERTSGGTVPLGDKVVTLRAYLEHFGFDGGAQRRAVSSLSGGERARVVLAKILKEGANLLLLDEPTNDLDTATLAALEELLETWPGCALMVSHDRAFLDNVATSIVVFEGDGRATVYPGNHETYLRLRPPPGGAPEGPASKPPPKAAAQAARAKPTTLSFNERKELDGMMERIAQAEATVARLAAELADPSLYAARGTEVARLRVEHEAAEAAVAKLYARWEALESRKG
ncbi:MAG: ABC-F family ATP-binding cassette domain-containing protein [Polyangiaceae bacterium]|nr:ABC-F family ATP-binding cassette domain-containing protein [Polyangiaceae bacterium]MBK8942125.1 ABC-F family ATP-binding cassette domain-containing protein [Polyangiaceae bacterium]